MAVKFNEKKSNRIEKKLRKDFNIIAYVCDNAHNIGADSEDAFTECTALLSKKNPTAKITFHAVKGGVLISECEWWPNDAQMVFNILNKNFYDGMKLEKEEVNWLESMGIV